MAHKFSYTAKAMGKFSFFRIVAPSAAMCVMMAAAAIAIAGRAGLAGGDVPLAYLLPAAAVGLIITLAWVFSVTLILARRKAPAPLAIIRRRLPAKLRFMALPLFIAPLFLAAFTIAKSGIARLTGFHWDHAFVDMDAWIFGTDPWRLTHAAFGPAATELLMLLYTAGWGFALILTNIFVAMHASRRMVGTYFLAMLSCWFINGFVLAYLFNSAGPVFAHLSDPALADRFAPLKASLTSLLPAGSPITTTQAYLASAVDSSVVSRGGGISAMPSMHIGAVAIMVMAARGTRWMWLALPFLLAIWVGSVHFGYHYAADGLVAIPVAILCWKLAELVYAPRHKSASMTVAAPRFS